MRSSRCAAAARLLATLLLVALAFCWGLRVGYDVTRPWELTDYGSLDAAQMSWVVEGIQERISTLQDRLTRAVEAQQAKLTARPPLRE